MSKLTNLCPHDIVIFANDGVTEIARVPVDQSARAPLRLHELPTEAMKSVEIDGILVPVCAAPRYGGLNYSPYSPQIVVSQLVAQYIVDHPQDFGYIESVYVPDAGAGAVRDLKGQIIGTKRLMRYK